MSGDEAEWKADLLGIERETFDSDEAFRDYVDEEFARLKAEIGEKADQEDVDRAFEEHAELWQEMSQLRENVERLRQQQMGGGDVAAREQMIVDELVERAQSSSNGKAHITAGEEEQSFGAPRRGIAQLLALDAPDGQTPTTAYDYMNRMAERYDGLWKREGKAGGWNGGQQKSAALRMDAERFIEAHGEDFGYYP